MRRTLLLLLTLTLATPVLGQYLLAIPGLDPPTFTSPDTDPAGFNVAENTTAITTVVATGDGTITYSVSGTDSALVTIGESSGVLTFIDPPNYEGPLDVGGDNVYTFNVVASNGTPASFECNVTVTDESEGSPTPPTITNADPLNVSMGENSTAVADIDATGDAPITFSISGTDASLFTINSSTGVLSFTDAPDFETPGDDGGNNVYNLTVTATGVSPPDSIDVVVTVTDVDESEYTYYNTLIARTDHIGSMSLRSQENIDDNSANMNATWAAYVDGTNTMLVYDGTEDACKYLYGTSSIDISHRPSIDFGTTYTTGCIVVVRDIKFNSSYYSHATQVARSKFSMLGHSGVSPGDAGNNNRRIEWRVHFRNSGQVQETSSEQFVHDTRFYGCSFEIGNTVTLSDLESYIPTDEWVRFVEVVDFEVSPDPTYSSYIVTADDAIITSYDAIPMNAIVYNGGLNFWTLWVNSSQEGESFVSLTSSGTTVTATTSVDHELEVGDPVKITGADLDYRGEFTVASVINSTQFTYQVGEAPSVSPASTAGRYETPRDLFWIRNCVVLHDTSTINMTPILVGDDL